MITIDTARRVLGKKYSRLTDDEIQAIISKFDLLANAFLDKREKEIFKGKTINQLLTKEETYV